MHRRFALARDLAALAPRLAAASARVQRERWLDRGDRRLARMAEPGFLARTLGVPRDRIAASALERIDSGTARRSRIRIRYAGEPAGPTSLFVKSRSPDFGSMLFGVLFDLGANEVAFYRRLRGQLPVPAPGVFHGEGGSADYVLLLEDLSEDARFRDLAAKCSAEEASHIVTMLARLHAPYWDSPRFGTDLAWVKRRETNRDRRLLDVVRRLAVPIAFEKYADVLPAELRAAVPRLLDRYEALETQWASGPRTLLHGDAHLGNMYFRAGEPGLLDWQVCQLGQGLRDVAYFLINSVAEEIRLEHQEALVRRYLATLAEHGVAFDFAAAWHQYRLQSVYAWIAGVVTAPSGFQPDAVVAAGLSRSSRALLDLDVPALIRAL